MTKTLSTHAQSAKKAMQSLHLLLKAVGEAPPHDAKSIAEMRNLVTFDAGHGIEPIEHSTRVAALLRPHPLAGTGSPGELVGDFELYVHFVATGEPVAGWAGVRVLEGGTLGYVAPDGSTLTMVEPLEATASGYDYSELGGEWFSRDYSAHCDPSMPDVVRERIASALEASGDWNQDLQPRGEAWCRTTEVIRQHSIRCLSGDKLAKTPELRWEPVALAALVRERGLVIHLDVLSRLGVNAYGRRPAIAHSSHA